MGFGVSDSGFGGFGVQGLGCHPVEFEGFVFSKFEGYVTRFAPHNSLMISSLDGSGAVHTV